MRETNEDMTNGGWIKRNISKRSDRLYVHENRHPFINLTAGVVQNQSSSRCRSQNSHLGTDNVGLSKLSKIVTNEQCNFYNPY